MMKGHMTPFKVHAKTGQTIKQTGKGAVEQVLPHKNAMATLHPGDVNDRSVNQYAKATPMAGPADGAAAGGLADPETSPMGSGAFSG